MHLISRYAIRAYGLGCVGFTLSINKKKLPTEGGEEEFVAARLLSIDL